MSNQANKEITDVQALKELVPHASILRKANGGYTFLKSKE